MGQKGRQKEFRPIKRSKEVENARRYVLTMENLYLWLPEDGDTDDSLIILLFLNVIIIF